MSRSFSVAYTQLDSEFAQRYPSIAHIPFILDSRPGMHRCGSQYLIERGTGLWPPPKNGSEVFYPTDKTLLSYARWLTNSLEWSDSRNVNFCTCDYFKDILGGYQKEMLEGTWSENGRALAPRTVNSRVEIACDYISWLAHKGFRSSFHVPFHEVRAARSQFPGMRRTSVKNTVKVRQGQVREPRHDLFLPASGNVEKWLGRVYEVKGETEGLMCETIIETAMRREEVVCLRKDTLPDDPAEWRISNPNSPENLQLVGIRIRYGTKGTSYGIDHGDKIGPARDILIPLCLAKKWHAYKTGRRVVALKQWMLKTKGSLNRQKRAQESVHLFLRNSDGKRFVGKELYDTWTGVELPMNGWCPRFGRHYWACRTLLIELDKQSNIDLTSTTAVALMIVPTINILLLQIAQQLGHANVETTVIYLNWAINQVRGSSSPY